MNQKIDVLYLFHSFDMEKTMLKNLITHIEKHTALRFAIGYYNSSAKVFHVSKFKSTHKEMKAIPFADIMELRAHITALDWEHTFKVYIYAL